MIQQVIISEKMKAFVHEYVRRHDWERSGKALQVNQSKIAQFVGLIGELTVHYYLKGSYPTLISGHDGGIDLIHNHRMIDVKTMQRKSFVRPEYVNNVHESQMNNIADTYVFCSYHQEASILEICGWITKEELKQVAPLHLAGSARSRDDGSTFTFKNDCREIQMKQLNAIDSLKGW